MFCKMCLEAITLVTRDYFAFNCLKVFLEYPFLEAGTDLNSGRCLTSLTADGHFMLRWDAAI